MNETAIKIQKLNDAFRKKLSNVILTKGIYSLAEIVQKRLIGKVIDFDDFNEDNDPYGEHDFWIIKMDWKKFYWKIDYYDKDRKYGSPDPSNEKETTRVLTILLAEER